jgi:methylmalonyl-CoA/ethylmalonyl-CoA epimerase
LNLSFHHVGVVTNDLKASAEVYEKLGYRASPVVEDPIQGVQIVLCSREGEPLIELIAPATAESPAKPWLERIKAGPYHTCYEVDRLDDAVEALRNMGFFPVSDPSPAVAFGGRSVVFLWGAATGLLELLERDAAKRSA